MLNKLIAAAALTLIALPVAASEISPGRDMLAKTLNVDASQYSLSELAQIDAERGESNKLARAKFIAAQHSAGISNSIAQNTDPAHYRDAERN